MVAGNKDEYVVSTKFMVIRPTRLLTSEFRYIYLTSADTLSELQSIAEHRSGTFPQITFDAIGHLQVPTPPEAAQSAIVRIASSLQGSIEALNAQNTSLEYLGQTLFHSWFVNFDPVHAKLAGNAPEAMSAELAGGLAAVCASTGLTSRTTLSSDAVRRFMGAAP